MDKVILDLHGITSVDWVMITVTKVTARLKLLRYAVIQMIHLQFTLKCGSEYANSRKTKNWHYHSDYEGSVRVLCVCVVMLI